MWKDLSVEESKRLARENAKDIIARGFDINRTFFSNFGYLGGAFYENVARVSKCVILNKARGIFGFRGEDHTGKPFFPSCVSCSFICQFVPTPFPGMDDLRCLIPCAIDQIYKYAFSGGQDSIEKHGELGANLEVDISIKYIGFFLEDDAEFEQMKTDYAAGRLLTGDVKNRLIAELGKIVQRHEEARKKVTEEVVDEFMKP